MQQRDVEALFPFHLILNTSLTVVGMGKSARKLFNHLQTGEKLTTHFYITRPKLEPSFESILEHRDSIFLLNSMYRKDLEVKGQMVHLTEENNILFVFTPIVRDVSYFSEFGITMQDFPYYDTTLELLFALLASQKALEEAQLINKEFEEKVKERTLELKLKNNAIKAQNEEYLIQQEQLNKQSIFLEEKNRRLQKAREIIHLKNKELRRYSKNLEKQVAERTEELTLINNELASQYSQLEQFAFIVAHNLRAPIARIFGLTNLMRLESLIKPENKYFIESINTATERLEEVIKDLNLILDVKSGLHKVYEQISLEEKIQKVIETLRCEIEESRAEIKTDFTNADIIYSVSSYIENIFYNLLSNAIKYRNADVPLTIFVSSYRQADDIIIRVEDNGIGIEIDKHKESLFRLYKRFHDHVDGKGMGLYMIKTQLDLLGASIEVESEKNKGTIFHLTFKDRLSETA